MLVVQTDITASQSSGTVLTVCCPVASPFLALEAAVQPMLTAQAGAQPLLTVAKPHTACSLTS